MVRYDVITDPDDEGLCIVGLRYPTLLDALRLGWRLWRKPVRYGVLVKVHRGWIEGYCAPVHGGRIFTAPLARDR